MKVLEAFGEPIADGGQESFVFGVIDRMDMTDFQVDCLTAYDCRSNYYRAQLKKKGGKVYSLKLPFTPGRSRRNIKAPFQAFLKKHSYDVVHIHSGSISVLAIMAEVADKAGVKKVIVHSHATGDKDNLRHKVLRFTASLSMRKHVDVYCACSKAAAEWKFEKTYAKRAIIIKNGIDPEKFRFNMDKKEFMRNHLNLSPQSFVIGHVGRFSWEKNHIFLVQIFKELSNRYPWAKLLLVGDGDLLPIIRKNVKSEKLEDKVIFTGSVNNVEDYLQAMDVFVLPSIYEGLPISVVEALATGLPAIISNKVPEQGLTAELIKKLPLDLGPDIWAEAILDYKGLIREDKSFIICKDGYDISQTAKIVRRIYDS